MCDSRMLRDFERLSMLGKKHRDERVARMGRRYRYGLMRGSISGESRERIDYAEHAPEGEMVELEAMLRTERDLKRTGRGLTGETVKESQS